MKNKTIKNEQSERKEVIVITVAAILTVIIALAVIIPVICNPKIREIEITNADVKIDENGEKYAVVYLDENGTASYKIEYKSTPENVKTNKLEFSYNISTPGVTVDEDGLVSFTEVTAVEVTVRPENSEDNSAEDKIFLIAKYKE